MAAYNKAWAAAVMAILGLIEIYFGLSFGDASEGTVLAIISILTPIIVWLVPNKTNPEEVVLPRRR